MSLSQSEKPKKPKKGNGGDSAPLGADTAETVFEKRGEESAAARPLPRGSSRSEAAEKEEHAARAEREASAVQLVAEQRRQSRVAVAGFVWTVAGTIYVMVSTSIMIGRKWIIAPYSYILIGLLAVYVVCFLALVGAYAGDASKGIKKMGAFKKVLKIFKTFANVLFLAGSAVSMAGVLTGINSFGQWFVFAVTLVVALVQLGLRIALLAMSISAKYLGKRYKVKIRTFVDGNEKAASLRDKLLERRYRQDDDKE